MEWQHPAGFSGKDWPSVAGGWLTQKLGASLRASSLAFCPSVARMSLRLGYVPPPVSSWSGTLRPVFHSQQSAGSWGAGMGHTEAPQDRGHLPVTTSCLPVCQFGAAEDGVQLLQCLLGWSPCPVTNQSGGERSSPGSSLGPFLGGRCRGVSWLALPLSH